MNKFIENLEYELSIQPKLTLCTLDCLSSTAKKLLDNYYNDLIEDPNTQFEDNEICINDPFIVFSVSKFLSLYYIKIRRQKLNNIL